MRVTRKDKKERKKKTKTPTEQRERGRRGFCWRGERDRDFRIKFGLGLIRKGSVALRLCLRRKRSRILIIGLKGFLAAAVNFEGDYFCSGYREWRGGREKG